MERATKPSRSVDGTESPRAGKLTPIELEIEQRQALGRELRAVLANEPEEPKEAKGQTAPEPPDQARR